MSFSYYTVYRTEGLQPRDLPRLTAAAPFPYGEPGKDSWIFWRGQDGTDAHAPTTVMVLTGTRSLPFGTVEVKREFDEKPFLLIPVTPEDVKKNPRAYGLNGANLSKLTQGEIYNVLHSMDVPEAYAEAFGPIAERLTQEDLDNLSADEVTELLVTEALSLKEARGIPAKVGDIHLWHYDMKHYQKQPDGSWRRVDSVWADDDGQSERPRSTVDKYFSKENGWAPERQRMHHQIVESMFHGKVKAEGRPVFTFVMGPPAAGKSTFVDGDKSMTGAVVLDSDHVLEQLPEFKEGLEAKRRSAAGEVHKEAMMVNDLALQKALDGGFNTIVPGTGGDLDWVQNELFPQLTERGYLINIVMPFCADLDELQLRAEQRGEVKGRFIPPALVADMYERLPTNFMKLIEDPRVASAAVYRTDNVASREGRFAPSEVFLRVRDVSGEQTDMVSDETSWKFFQSGGMKANEGLEEQVRPALPKSIAQQLFDVQKLLAADLERLHNAPRKYSKGSGAVDIPSGRLTLPYDPR